MSLYDTFRHCIETEMGVAMATIVAGPRDIGDKLLAPADGQTEGSMRDPQLSELVMADARRLLASGRPETIRYDLEDGSFDVFIDVYPVLPQLIIVGATQTAIPLASLGKMLGYRVTVTDARGAFAVPERFPDADRVIKGWPQDVLPQLRLDAETYVVLLSHDPKFDEPTLQHVLPSDVRYIGAIGSRKTQQERSERLAQEGFSDDQVTRVYGPVGLDLGGRSVEETALAIMAEITAVRYGHDGGFMRRKIGR